MFRPSLSSSSLRSGSEVTMAPDMVRRSRHPVGLTKPEGACVLLVATFTLILVTLASWLAVRIAFSRTGSVLSSVLDPDEPAWPFRREDARRLGLGRLLREDLRTAPDDRLKTALSGIRADCAVVYLS